MPRTRLAVYALSGAVTTAIVLAWLYRSDIVTRFVDEELAARNVAASYDIEQIGLGRQRLRNVVIGDPADPDLVIDRLDLSVALGISGPYIAAVGIDGARLRGRWVDGKLTFGAVDRLIPEDDGTPPEIPDMALRLRRTAAIIDTPWGQIGFGAQGSGRLTDGFAGNVALRAARVSAADCRAERLEGNLRLSVSDRQPRITGPIGAAVLVCKDTLARVADVRIGLNGAVARSLDRLQLNVGLRTGLAGLADHAQLASLRGAIDVTGSVDGAGTMQWELRGTGPQTASLAADELLLNGRGGRSASGAIAGTGSASFARLHLDDAGRRNLAGLAQSAIAGLPSDPLILRLAEAVDRASRGGSASLSYQFNAGEGLPARISLGDVRVDAQSGAYLQLVGANVVTLAADGRDQLRIDARFGGGGLPSGQVAAQSKPGQLTALTGQAVIAPYGDGDAAIALNPVRFSSDAGGTTRFSTALRLSGPLAGGRIDNLALAVDGAVDAGGHLALSGRCQHLRWDRIVAGGLQIGVGSVPICGQGGQPVLRAGPQGAGGTIAVGATRLSGRIGESPLSINWSSGSFSVSDRRLMAQDIAVTMGSGDDDTILAIASLSGAPATGAGRSGFGGDLSGARGQIANVPFRFSDIAGSWLWQDGGLSIQSALTVSDAARDARFQPLIAQDATLRYAGDRITVHGTLVEPGTRTSLAVLDIEHDLASARGHADIAVNGVTFARGGLQPVMLTRLTLGVIADTTGTVRGRGRVDWSGTDVSSSGRFSTDALDFSAAFGPVQGLSGTLNLSDLINLESPPGQEVRLASVNPGIEVTDGIVRYRLLPGQQVGLESGEWPLAGGRLLLRPTVLDFGIESARHLTFDLDGLDAGLFLSRFEFDNINATGQFDGTIPTIFDANGGRIEGGLLRSRAGGGLAYVGELTYQDLGLFGNLAFGALRSLRYDRLDIRLNGRIDGDMLTEVDFSGLAQGEGVANNIVTRAIRRLPVVFRIRINAPFRSLLTSARGLYDPTILIDQNLSALIREQRAAEAHRLQDAGEAVQPRVSDVDR